MPKIQIEITIDDVTMMQAIAAYILNSGGRTPKKREVVTRSTLPLDYQAARAARVFERLKLLGLVQHHLNGHCELTSQGKSALRRAVATD